MKAFLLFFFLFWHEYLAEKPPFLPPNKWNRSRVVVMSNSNERKEINLNLGKDSREITRASDGPHDLKIVIFGAPCSGKGTLCGFLKKQFNLKHISSGDLLREAVESRSELGKRAEEYMTKGQLVPDELLLKLVANALDLKKDAERGKEFDGWLLDGFPRTVKQSEYLKDQNVECDCVVVLKTSDDVLISRMENRRVDPYTGNIYHMILNKPKSETILKRLVKREDDDVDVLKKRINTFNEYIGDILNSYEGVTIITLDATKTPGEIFEDFLQQYKQTINNSSTPHHIKKD